MTRTLSSLVLVAALTASPAAAQDARSIAFSGYGAFGNEGSWVVGGEASMPAPGLSWLDVRAVVDYWGAGTCTFGTCGPDPSGVGIRAGVAVRLPGAQFDPYFEASFGRRLGSDEAAGSLFDTGFGGLVGLAGPVRLRIGARLLGYLPDEARDPDFVPMALLGLAVEL